PRAAPDVAGSTDPSTAEDTPKPKHEEDRSMIRRLFTLAVFAATVASPWTASALTQCQYCIEIFAPETYHCAAVCGGVFQLQLALLPTFFPPEPAWLQRVNLYRSIAQLAGVSENTSLASGEQHHATYMVATDQIGHTESTSSPYYTTDGALAAQNSNVAGSTDPSAADAGFVDMWMQGPFHDLGIIDPRLVSSEFGIAHDSIGGVRSAAALDVLRGRTGSLANVTFPVIYPANGTMLPVNSYTGGENPDPLARCSGFAPPTAPPLILQFSSTPSPAAGSPMASLTCGTTSYPTCVYNENSFPLGSTERNILAMRHATIIIGRSPLPHGASCTASYFIGGMKV